MKKLNLNINVKIEDDLYNIGLELTHWFKRINVKDEAVIRKVQVYIDYLEKGDEFELDDVDFKQFKALVIACDVWQAIKMEVLKVFDKLEKKN